MNKILVFIFGGLVLSASAQTAIIAHKSHSGGAIDFFVDPSTNFGEPGPQLIQIVRVDDSTYIEVYHSFSGMTYHDTVRKNSPFRNYNKDVDSIYQLDYYKHIEYINLKTTSDAERVKAPSFQPQRMIENSKSTPEKINREPIQETTPKKKKKSYLLFLFGITGGGMLLMRLFSRSKVAKPSIAR